MRLSKPCGTSAVSRVKGQNVCLARRVAGVRFGLFECRLSGCSRCCGSFGIGVRCAPYVVSKTGFIKRNKTWDTSYPTPGLMTWVQRQRSSDLGRVVAGSSGSPGPWSLNCRARRQGQHGRSSASNACWCTGSVEGAHEVVGWPTMGRSTRLRMTWSRNTPGCPQVGHSLIGSTGSASITVTSPFSVAPVIVVPSFAVRQMVSTMTFPLGCTVGP